MSVVNTNVSASLAQAALNKNQRALGTAMEQLSTGSKINSAKDDAAGLAMASKFTAQIKGLDMAVKNANDAISMISTAEGAMTEVTSMLQRMRELAVQSSNGTVTAEDRGYMDLEYQALEGEINRIAENTQWNGENVLDGTAGSGSGTTSSKVTFQVSANYAPGTVGSNGSLGSPVVMTSASHVLGDLNISALYNDGAQAAVNSAAVNYTADTLNTALGLAADNLQDTGAVSDDLAASVTAAAPVLYTTDSFVADLSAEYVEGALGTAFTEVYNNGDTASNYRAARVFTEADMLSTIQVTGTGANPTELYSDGTTAAAAGNFKLTAASSLDAWDSAITTFVGQAANSLVTKDYNGDGTATTHELKLAFDAAVTASATDPSSPSLGETTAAEYSATNTKMTADNTRDEWVAALNKLSAGFGTAAKTAGDPRDIAAFSGAAGTDKIAHIVKANPGTDLQASDTVDKWRTAVQLHDTANNNGTTMLDAFNAIVGDAAGNTLISAIEKDAPVQQNTLLTDSNTLAQWKSAIEAAGLDPADSAAFNEAHKNEGNALSSVVREEEVAPSDPTNAKDSNHVIIVDFGDLGADMAHLDGTGLTTQASSQSAISSIDTALTSVNSQRAEFGAATNRLEYAVDNMTNTQNNAEASRSRIMDTDYAETTSELAKAQIIAQAGTAMLAQANQSSQSVLSLLR